MNKNQKQKKFTLNPGKLTRNNLHELHQNKNPLELKKTAYNKIKQSQKVIQEIIQNGKPIYGVNTGFGSLANINIPSNQLAQLQKNLLLSHAVGTGPLLDDDIVHLILLLKINSLSRGHSGVRKEIIDALITLFNKQLYPCIPSKGSVGASGDLAPLAHLAGVLIGVGKVRHQGKTISAKQALSKAGLKVIQLAPKEGLALLNGTQVSTAIALRALMLIENCFAAAIITGSLSLDAAKGSDEPFNKKIHDLRGHKGQSDCAAMYRKLLKGSQIRKSHLQCDRIQDPYSLRCQPQAMGACLDHIRFASHTIFTEVNAVTDNPLVFPETKQVLTGGNFHAEPIAMAADTLALAIAEIGALSERRIALLMDEHQSGHPPFLAKDSGINSGFMIAQVTAAALASENKSLAHPASVDSIPTSANQEDHVSMATFAARRRRSLFCLHRPFLLSPFESSLLFFGSI